MRPRVKVAQDLTEADPSDVDYTSISLREMNVLSDEHFSVLGKRLFSIMCLHLRR